MAPFPLYERGGKSENCIALKVWKEGLTGDGGQLGKIRQHMVNFKRVLKLEVEPGGRYPAEREKPRQRDA